MCACVCAIEKVSTKAHRSRRIEMHEGRKWQRWFTLLRFLSIYPLFFLSRCIWIIHKTRYRRICAYMHVHAYTLYKCTCMMCIHIHTQMVVEMDQGLRTHSTLTKDHSLILFFLLRIFLNYISNAIPKVPPHPSPFPLLSKTEVFFSPFSSPLCSRCFLNINFL